MTDMLWPTKDKQSHKLVGLVHTWFFVAYANEEE